MTDQWAELERMVDGMEAAQSAYEASDDFSDSKLFHAANHAYLALHQTLRPPVIRELIAAARANSVGTEAKAVLVLGRLVDEVESFDRAPDTARIWMGGWSTYSGQRDPLLIHVGEVRAAIGTRGTEADQ